MEFMVSKLERGDLSLVNRQNKAAGRAKMAKQFSKQARTFCAKARTQSPRRNAPPSIVAPHESAEKSIRRKWRIGTGHGIAAQQKTGRGRGSDQAM
jgi:hypothetical protein